MKSRLIFVFIAVVLGLGVLNFARQSMHGKSDDTAQVKSDPGETAAALKTESAARIGVIDENEHKNVAAARIGDLRKSHRGVEKNLDAALGLSESEAEGLADIMARQTAQAEQSLIDSMSSLTQQLVNEPGSTTSVIELLRQEQDPQLMILIAQALGEAAGALGKDFPHDLLAQIAMNDPSFERRAAAMLALSYMSEIPADLMLRMTEISQSGPTPQLRSAAIDCMGQWMNRSPDLLQPVTQALLAARTASDDPFVRGMVIQTIGNSNAPLAAETLTAMSDAIRHETVATNRSLAAVALGSGTTPENRSSVIGALENAYQSEPNLDTRRHIITQIVKAARGDAATYLQRLPTPDPLLAQDVRDYVEIMAGSDPENWGHIWDQKSHRDNLRGTYPGADGGHGKENLL